MVTYIKNGVRMHKGVKSSAVKRCMKSDTRLLKSSKVSFEYHELGDWVNVVIGDDEIGLSLDYESMPSLNSLKADIEDSLNEECVKASEEDIEKIADYEYKLLSKRFGKTVKSARRIVKSSVDWGDFDTPEADAINEKYLPNQGEGDTKATQAVTAVNKLVYQWYNNGEVYDNRGGFGETVNGCDTYANWLADNVDGAYDILESGLSDESRYEDALKQLFDLVFDESLLEQLNMEPKEGSVYDYDGDFSTDHEVCSECSEDITDDSSAIDPESGDGDFEQMVWGELARNSDFSDLLQYSYGFYEPNDEGNELYDLYNDWYQDWYRNRDNTMLCRSCAESVAEDAVQYIKDNYDWYDDDGYNKITGFNDEGYDREGYDEEGYNEGGIDREGYNREGLDAEGRDHEGFDKEGYDKEGLDRKGLDRNKRMGSKRAMKNFLGVDPDEDLNHDYDYYKRR